MLTDFAKLNGRSVTVMLGVAFVAGALVVAASRGGSKFPESTADKGATTRLGVKTRRAERAEKEKPERGDVLLAFQEKVTEGMSLREIRWIVDDFLNAGLGQTALEAAPAEAYFETMKKQHRWYAETLSSGLGLSDQQEREVEKHLSDAAESAMDKLNAKMTSVKPFEVDGKTYRITNASDLYALTDPRVWLEDEAYRPWKMCDLDERQMELLKVGKDSGAGDQSVSARNGSEGTEGGVWFPLIFPLSDEQSRAPGIEPSSGMPVDGKNLEAYRLMHPAQFRQALLTGRKLAVTLQEVLAKSAN